MQLPVIAQYQFNSYLGTGSLGDVFQAFHYPSGQDVAVKIINPEIARQPGASRRFYELVKSVRQLEHPHIISVIDAGEIPEESSFYMTTPLFAGQDLQAMRHGDISLKEIILLIRQVVNALAYSHARGIVHGDLKPSNILIRGRNNQLKTGIIDFSLSSITVPGDTETTNRKQVRIVGSPQYMSPEQTQGDPNITGHTDLYNVGLILYELVAGRPPFQGETAEILMHHHCMSPVPRPLPRPGLDLPEPLELLIASLLEKDIADRPQSASLVEQNLQQIALKSSRGLTPGKQSIKRTTGELIQAVQQPSSTQPPMRWDPPYVGHEFLRSSLIKSCEIACKEKRPSVVSLEGAAGLGKTRTVRWLIKQLEQSERMQIFVGACLKEDNGELRALRDVLEQALGTKGMKRDAAKARLETVGDQLQLGKGDLEILLDLLKSTKTDAKEDFTATDHPRHQQLFASLSRTLISIASDKPTLMILENLHWSGEQFASFFTYLSPILQEQNVPIVFIITVRSEALAQNNWLNRWLNATGSHAESVLTRQKLNPLERAEMVKLLSCQGNLSAALMETLIERSGGNPLYAIELLGYLHDRGHIVTDSNQQLTPASIEDILQVIPPNLSSLLLIRLVELSRRFAESTPLVPVLERAAILGSRFPLVTLEQMISGDEHLRTIDLQETLDIALEEGILCYTDSGNRSLIDFRQSMLRDVLLQQMAPRRATRQLHRLAAEAKQHYFAAQLDLVAHQIAIHYELAGDITNALYFTQKAAQSAEKMHRLWQAAELWSHYIERCGPELETGDCEQTLPDISFARLQFSKLAESLGWYDRAESCLSHLPLPSEAHTDKKQSLFIQGALTRGEILGKKGRIDDAVDQFTAAHEASLTLENGPLIARSLLGLAKAHHHRGHDDMAITACSKAIEVSSLNEDGATEAAGHWLLGRIHRLLGQLDEARKSFLLSQQLYADLKNTPGSARSLYGLALVHRADNNLVEAESHFLEAYQQFSALGMIRAMGHCLNGLGEVARFQDNPQLARRYYNDAVSLYHRVGLESDGAKSQTNLGILARDEGDLNSAQVIMEMALKVAERDEYHYLAVSIALNLCWVYALQGEDEKCQVLLSSYLQRIQENPVLDPDIARPLEGIADLLNNRGQMKEAQALYATVLDMWERFQRHHDASRVAAYLH